MKSILRSPRRQLLNFTYLASRCIPSRVARENRASNAPVSAYLFRLVHYYQYIHTCLQGVSMLFQLPSCCTFNSVFSKVNRGLSLPYRSLLLHKIFLPFFHHCLLMSSTMVHCLLLVIATSNYIDYDKKKQLENNRMNDLFQY